ncbi:uncharacterized protein [Argopecten irradians]|uniref:uncharacterized protein n=1 Tax=Argopecten irradians TaxID=31199 RepID=UPI003712ECC0
MELELYNESCEIVSVPSFPVRPFLTTATFTPNNSYHVLLEVAFGKATTSSEGQTLATRKTLLSDTKVFEYCEFVSNVDDIRPTIDGLMWIREGSVLTLMDKTGQKIQKIVHTAKIIDICISPTSHSLWICDKKKNVMKLGLDILPRRIFTQLTNKLKHKEEPELRHFAQMFRTKKKPRCMCITGSDHVIVGMTNQLSKFTTKGEQVLTTMAASLIKPEVSTPHRVAECPVTHNVAVIDSNDADDSHKHVVVLNADFIKLFVCRNDITFLENTELELLKCEPDEAKYLHYINDLNSPLCPQDVMYDSEGNLLIVHKKPLHRQYRILLFNGGGNFRIGIHHESHMRRTHMRRNERPSVWVDKDDHDSHIQCNERPSVCIDKDDIVWVADKELLEVQYSQ